MGFAFIPLESALRLSAGVLNLVGGVARFVEGQLLKYVASTMDSPVMAIGAGPNGARETMADLLERSVAQDTQGGRDDWHSWVLQQLLPDEARIVAALAEGDPVPLVHVLSRASQTRLLENASLIGRTAALTLPDMTPTYVGHLRALGIVGTGPEDQSDGPGYELLLADRAVRAALKEGTLGKLPARVVRRTLRLTDQGRALWEHTQPTSD